MSIKKSDIRKIIKEELSIFDQHKIKIAKDTLKMPYEMVGVMGNVTKKDAIHTLMNHGWTAEKIANYLAKYDYSHDEIRALLSEAFLINKKQKQLNEAFEEEQIYNDAMNQAIGNNIAYYMRSLYDKITTQAKQSIEFTNINDFFSELKKVIHGHEEEFYIPGFNDVGVAKFYRQNKSEIIRLLVLQARQLHNISELEEIREMIENEEILVLAWDAIEMIAHWVH